MGEVQELIQRYCPDGVEHRRLGEVVVIKNGRDYKHLSEGEVPVYGTGGIMTYVDTASATGPSVLIPRKGSIGNVFYVEGPFWNIDTVFRTEIDETKIMPMFLYYVMESVDLEGLAATISAGRPSLTQSLLNGLEIPVPPLEVQQAIVKVLDDFVGLERELRAELDVRTRQYEHYRDELLTFSEDVERVALKELYANFISPVRDRPKVFDGDTPWCRVQDVDSRFLSYSKEGLNVSQEVIGDMHLKVYPKGTVLVAVSANIGTCAITTRPMVSNQRFVGIVCNEHVNNEYLRYVLEANTRALKRMATTGTIAGITRRQLDEMTIPLPPLDEQQRIVDNLDAFDDLVTSRKAGIPAEIDIRHAQYEHYRDALLDLPKKGDQAC